MLDHQTKQEDREFYKNFALVILTLAVLALIFIFIGRAIAPSRTSMQELTQAEDAIKKRIEPVGKVYYKGDELPEEFLLTDSSTTTLPPAPTRVDTSAPAPAIDGQVVYTEACALCHASGLAGAPKPEDKSLWESRLTQGKDTLYQNAINGIRAMPAKGGRPDLSDAQVKAAVDYMASF